MTNKNLILFLTEARVCMYRYITIGYHRRRRRLPLLGYYRTNVFLKSSHDCSISLPRLFNKPFYFISPFSICSFLAMFATINQDNLLLHLSSSFFFFFFWVLFIFIFNVLGYELVKHIRIIKYLYRQNTACIQIENEENRNGCKTRVCLPTGLIQLYMRQFWEN